MAWIRISALANAMMGIFFSSGKGKHVDVCLNQTTWTVSYQTDSAGIFYESNKKRAKLPTSIKCFNNSCLFGYFSGWSVLTKQFIHDYFLHTSQNIYLLWPSNQIFWEIPKNPDTNLTHRPPQCRHDEHSLFSPLRWLTSFLTFVLPSQLFPDRRRPQEICVIVCRVISG